MKKHNLRSTILFLLSFSLTGLIISGPMHVFGKVNNLQLVSAWLMAWLSVPLMIGTLAIGLFFMIILDEIFELDKLKEEKPEIVEESSPLPTQTPQPKQESQ